MLRVVIHYASAVLAGASALAFIGLGTALVQFLNPERSPDDKLTTWFTPNRRPSDFVGVGWRLQRLQWLAMVVCGLALLLFGFTWNPL
jgi:hypothetical protein